VVSFPSCPEPLGAPLDAVPTSAVIAARTEATLHELEGIPAALTAPARETGDEHR
jgi:hypothetical protein